MKIEVPKEPTLMAAANFGYAGIAKRLHVELSNLTGDTGPDLEAIKADLINEAKKAVPQGDFARDEIGVYKTMFQAIETIFGPNE